MSFQPAGGSVLLLKSLEWVTARSYVSPRLYSFCGIRRGLVARKAAHILLSAGCVLFHDSWEGWQKRVFNEISCGYSEALRQCIGIVEERQGGS